MLNIPLKKQKLNFKSPTVNVAFIHGGGKCAEDGRCTCNDDAIFHSVSLWAVPSVLLSA